MEQEKLNAELVDLHRELGSVVENHEQLDPQMIASLRQVAADIAQILQDQTRPATVRDATTSAAAAPDSDAPAEPLPRTLEELAVQFSVDHPQTAALLSRLGYLLGNMGI